MPGGVGGEEPRGSPLSRSIGQHGNTWFLGGTINTEAKVERSCKIPSGTRILLAVINGECSVVEDASLDTRDKLRACAKGQMDFVTAATAKLDGRALPVLRRQSPLFSFTLPEDNVLHIGNRTPIQVLRSPRASGCLSGPCLQANMSSRPMARSSCPVSSRSLRT